MSGATRRRVIISSDEDDDPVDSHDLLSDDGEAEESVVQDSLPPTPTSRSFAPDLRMSSTPKSTTRSSTMDEVENSPAKSLDRMSYRDGDDRSIRSESGNSVDSDHERSRSFLGSPVVESPISARLAAKEDVASKQALRERLLRKQHEKHRAVEGKSQSMRGARRSLNQPFKNDPMDSATVEDEDSSQYDTPDSSPNGEGDKPDAVMSKDSPAKTTGITSLSSLLNPSCFNPRFTTPRKSLAAIPSDDEDDLQTGDHNAKKRQTGSGGADSPINISDSDLEEEGNTVQTVEIEDTDEEEKEDKENVEGEDGSEDEHGQDVDSEGEALVASNGMHPSTLPTLTDRDADIDKKEKELERALTLLSKTGSKLPDGGDKIRKKIEELTDEIETLRAIAPARRVPVPPLKPKLAVIQPPHLTMNQYNNLISNKTKNLFGGKMTGERVDNISRVTEDLLVGLHKEMTTMPDGEETETPKGMTVQLMGHQKKGLTWMLWREGQRSPGGILADDMGLGKTISLISLLMAKRNARKDGEKAKTEDEEEKKQAGEWEKRKTAALNSNLLPSNATLVIVPASVVYQWKKELEDRVEPGLLNILVFHGPKREKQAKRVVRHDVVITTYDTVRSEMTVKVELTNDSDSEVEEEDDQASRRGKKKESAKVRSDKKSVLTAIAWERVILDEAHNIKNRNSLVSRAVCKIPATYRWCLTGTPVHNNLYDLFSLIRFLRVRPFDEVQAWMQYIMANNRGAADRLNTLTKSLLLRRTKEMVDSSTGKPIVALKQKLFETHELEFTGLEKSIYDHMMKVSRQKVLKLMADMDGASDGFLRRRKKELGAGEKLANPFLGGPREVSTSDKFQAMSSVLTLLLRLRQAAVHLALTRDALDLEAFEGLGTGDGAEEQALAAAVADITLDEDAETAEEVGASAEEVEKVFEKKFKSAKIVALLDLLDEVLKSGDKCVIVSQWTSLLDLVKDHINRRRVEYTSIDGTVPMTDRQERVNSFNRTDGGTQVMLLSLRAGGVGLNLVGGNHLFLLDLHWNPALELQACDRIYRMGQTKNVYIHKLVMKGTVEAQVLALQESKMSLAKSVLEGAAKKLNKLTMNDLKFLFQLDDRAKIAAGDADAPSTSSAPPARR